MVSGKASDHCFSAAKKSYLTIKRAVRIANRAACAHGFSSVSPQTKLALNFSCLVGGAVFRIAIYDVKPWLSPSSHVHALASRITHDVLSHVFLFLAIRDSSFIGLLAYIGQMPRRTIYFYVQPVDYESCSVKFGSW